MISVFNKNKFKKTKAYYFASPRGQSMIEIIIALGVFVTLVSVLFSFSLQGLIVLERSSYYNKAFLFLNEEEEAVRAIAKTDWNSLKYSQSAIGVVFNNWTLLGEGSIEDLTNFSRTIYFGDVFRDDNNIIVVKEQTGSVLDNFSKYADIHVNWQVPDQNPIFLHRKILLTHYFSSTTPIF